MGKIEDKAKELVANAKQKAKDKAKSGAKKAGRAMTVGLYEKMTASKVVRSTHDAPTTVAKPLELDEWESPDVIKAQKQVTKVLHVVQALDATGGKVEGGQLRIAMAMPGGKFKLDKTRKSLKLYVSCGSSAEATVVGGSLAELAEDKQSSVTEVRIDPAKKAVIVEFGV